MTQAKENLAKAQTEDTTANAVDAPSSGKAKKLPPKRLESKTDGFRIQQLLNRDEIHAVLQDSFYQDAEPSARSRSKKATTSKADHYQVVCVSLYEEDVAKLDEVVDHLKASGQRRVSRSLAVRIALQALDLQTRH